jgi:8-oxo-dGTP diphosphatase
MAISPYLKHLRDKIGNDLLLIPSAGGVIFDDTARVLLQRAKDDGNWYVPGGAIDPGEQPATAIVREMREETGLIVEPVRIVAVTTSPQFSYPNGHRVQYVGTIFLCRAVGGTLGVGDDESLELRYFSIDELPELRHDHRRWIEAARGEDRAPFFFPPTLP